MITAVALTVAAAALVGAVEFARIRLVRGRFARAVHAHRGAVPPGPGRHPPHPTAVAGTSVVGAMHGPVGALDLQPTTRPGHQGGAA
jgi:hypothetical protein